MGANANGTYTKTSLIFKTLIRYKANGRKLKEIAKDCGVTYQSLANYRDGRTKPNKRDYEMIAMGFGVPTAFIDEKRNDIESLLKNSEKEISEYMEGLTFDGVIALKYDVNKKRKELTEELYSVLMKHGKEEYKEQATNTIERFFKNFENDKLFPFSASITHKYSANELMNLYYIIGKHDLMKKSKLIQSTPLSVIKSDSKKLEEFTKEVFEMANEIKATSKDEMATGDMTELPETHQFEIEYKIMKSLNELIILFNLLIVSKQKTKLVEMINLLLTALKAQILSDEMAQSKATKNFNIIVQPKKEYIKLCQIEEPNEMNGGFVYGAMNYLGEEMGGRFLTLAECKEYWELKGFKKADLIIDRNIEYYEKKIEFSKDTEQIKSKLQEFTNITNE